MAGRAKRSQQSKQSKMATPETKSRQRTKKSKSKRRAIPPLVFDPKRTGFFSLSAELRNRIYEHMLPHMHQMRYSTCTKDTNNLVLLCPSRGKMSLEWGQRSKPGLGAMFRICKQFSAEFRPVYFGSWDRVILCHGKTSKKRALEGDERIANPSELMAWMERIGEERKFLRKLEINDDTPLDVPGPSKEDVKRRLEQGGLRDLLVEGQRVQVTLTMDPFGDVREYGTAKYCFEATGDGRELSFVEYKAGYA